jgi:hypothetical protein
MPPWAWLAYLALTSVVVDVALGRIVRAPIVFKDELIYSQLGRSIAEHHLTAMAAVLRSGYGVVYPLLLAPFYMVFHDLPSAYTFSKYLNAAAWSSSIVPCYLLGRRVLPVGWSIAAAGLTVLGPQAIFAALVMTENVYMPVFLWTCLVTVRMLERPSLARQGVAVLLIAIGIATRLQAVALVPGVLVAVAVAAFAAGRSGAGSRLRPYSTMSLLLLAAAVTLAFAEILRGGSIHGALGAYSVLAHGYSPWETLKWTVRNVAELDLLLGVVVFALAPVAIIRALRGHESTPASRAIAATLVGFGATMVVMVGMFSGSAQGEHRLHERYLIYLVPLVLILAFATLRSRASPTRRELAPWLGLAALLPLTIPFEHIASQSWIDALGVQPWLNNLLPAAHLYGAMVLAAMVLAGVGLALSRRIRAYALAALVAASFFAFTSARAHAKTNGRFAVTRADWIDRVVGGRDVAAIFVPALCLKANAQELRWIAMWRAEFFNRRVNVNYHVGRALPGGRGSRLLHVGPSGILSSRGRPIRVAYALVERGVPLAGTAVAQEVRQGLTLVRVEGPLRLKMSSAAERLSQCATLRLH